MVKSDLGRLARWNLLFIIAVTYSLAQIVARRLRLLLLCFDVNIALQPTLRSLCPTITYLSTYLHGYLGSHSIHLNIAANYSDPDLSLLLIPRSSAFRCYSPLTVLEMASSNSSNTPDFRSGIPSSIHGMPSAHCWHFAGKDAARTVSPPTVKQNEGVTGSFRRLMRQFH